MIWIIFVSIILMLIISTTFIKSHTKKLEDKIFLVRENINYLNSVMELVQLEHNYLSNPETLLRFNDMYFEDKLNYTLRENIIIIDDLNNLNLKKLKLNE